MGGRSKSEPTPLPPCDLPPSLAEKRKKAKELLADGNRGELFKQLREDLMVNYLLDVEAGQDTEVNPQHSRASRKQALEIANLLIQISDNGAS